MHLIILIICVYFFLESILFSSRKVEEALKTFTKYWKVYIILYEVYSRNQSYGNCNSHCN